MNDQFDYIAFVVFEDDTYRYAFNADTVEILGGTPEEAARSLCPRKDPDDVIIIE